MISEAVNRPAPRIVSAIEDLARQLHPDAFAEKPESGKEKLQKEAPPPNLPPAAQSSFLSGVSRPQTANSGGLRMRPLTLRRLLLQCSILVAILFVVVVVALKFGAVPVSLYALGRDLLRVVFGQSSQISSDYGLIIVNIRLPRILLGIIVGASLSVAGTSFQALLRNPLADPYVLGVSSGASLGAILALIVEPHLSLSRCSRRCSRRWEPFLGATATIAAVYFLGRREGQIDSTTLLLGGVITGSFLSAIILFLMSTLTGSLSRPFLLDDGRALHPFGRKAAHDGSLASGSSLPRVLSTPPRRI